MKENRDYLDIAAVSVKIFGKDGKLNESELDDLLEIALRDNTVDKNEVRVLSNILDKLKSYELSTDMRNKIRDFEHARGVSIL
jgi:hypothetical protein